MLLLVTFLLFSLNIAPVLSVSHDSVTTWKVSPKTGSNSDLHGFQESKQYTVKTRDISLACHKEKGTGNICFSGGQCGHFPGHNLGDILHCREQRLVISNCYCATYNEEKDLLEVGSCLINCGFIRVKKDSNRVYVLLPQFASELDEFFCDEHYKRTGTLCGRCQNGSHPLTYSFDMNCVQCNNLHLSLFKFFSFVFLPLTVFYFVVLFFRISVTTSLRGFLLFSQIGSFPAMARFLIHGSIARHGTQKAVRYLLMLHGIWNLDFFRSLRLDICLGLDTLPTLALDLAVGIYPLILMVISYLMINLYDRNFAPLVCMWRPFRVLFGLLQRNWHIRTSLVDSFSTFFLLSNIKFLSVSFDLLAPAIVYQVPLSDPFNYSASWRVYNDVGLQYFGPTHLPYAILSIMVLVLFVLLPVLLLILYPFAWFQRLLNKAPFRWHVILHTFVDSFQGCYKNGTEPGTRDFRWFASVYFILGFVLVIFGTLNLDDLYFTYSSIILVFVCILLVTLQPFKPEFSHYTITNLTFILFLSLWLVHLIGLVVTFLHMPTLFHYLLVTTVFVSSFPILYISTIILHWLFRRRKFGWEFVRRVSAWRRGYDWWVLE